MPNNTSNYIVFDRELTEEEIDNIKNKLFDEEKEELDFNKLIKQPKHIIKVGIGTDIIKAYSWYFFKNPDNLSKEELEKTLLEEEKLLEIECKYKELSLEAKKTVEKEIGYKPLENWYDWNRKNWGTSRKAYNTEFQGNDILFFNTAWCRPNDNLLNKLFIKLEEIIPKEDIEKISYEVEYETDDIREFYKFVNGKIEFIKSENY